MPDPRTLIVTGASAGIGRALALVAARKDYLLVIVARRSAELEAVARQIRDAGGTCAALASDVTAPQTPARIVQTAMQSFGRIDVVVSNAGRGAYGLLIEESDAAIEQQWQLHVAAPLRIARAALPHLQAAHGQLVFVGSGIVRVPLPGYGAYALAKAAVRAAATQLRRELRPRGIAVTYVDPGVVASEFHSTIGVERPPIAVSAQAVARAILRGIERRRAVVNAVPWQTTFATLGEWSGTLADSIIAARFAPTPRYPDPSTRPSASLRTALRAGAEEISKHEGQTPANAFDRALEPVARRMERVKLPPDFLRAALVPGATLELGALAMRWAGMPNKNERAALHEALDALTAGGYLERTEEEAWRVVRAAD
jgi:uncharacterized oxidoreductase